MVGFLSFAPIYPNGVLALICIFVLPGLLLVRAFDIPSFPQKWFVVFLSSLAANHVLVTLIAALHLDPLWTYRMAVAAVAAILILMMAMEAAGSRRLADRGSSILQRSDIGWLGLALAILCLTYFNVWKYGVPHIFDEGDVSVSWNVWARLWSDGQFPTASLGYPQFIPTIWAVTYIFTGSPEQYFAFYSYIVLIIAPLAFNAMNLGRRSWINPLLAGLVFVWFVAEIREPWLRSILPQASPDWVAAIFGFCGVVLFITSAPEGRFDREKMVAALVSLCLVSIAAATKPLFGLFAIAILLAIGTDAVRHLDRIARNRFCIGAVALFALFAATYALDYAHLAARGMPNYPVAELSERLSQATKLLNSNFTIPFKILVLAGVVLCPFQRRLRWLALPLLIGFFVWADTASYDLRNLLGLLLVSAFIPLVAAARAFDGRTAVVSSGPPKVVRDGVVAAILVVITVGLTWPLAVSDQALKERFARDQLAGGSGLELNRTIEQALRRGCTVFSSTAYINTISAFEPFRQQIRFFFFTNPLDQPLIDQFNEATGCTSVFYPPERINPSILRFVEAYAKARGLVKVADGNGMELIASP